MPDNIFGSDFWPTPRQVGRRMFKKIKNDKAYYYLEPSAGRGDLCDVIKEPTTYEEWEAELSEQEREDREYDRVRGHRWDRDNHRVQIDAIECEPSLISVLRGKEYDVVGYDWLTHSGTSYVDVIMMNPPFSNGAAHLLKAWDWLYKGEIVCLLNEETIKNPFSEERKQLLRIIEAANGEVEYWDDCFSTAERKTDARVVCVYLKKDPPDDTFDLWAREATEEKNNDPDGFGGDHAFIAIRDNLGNMEHFFNRAIEHWLVGIDHIRRSQLYMKELKLSDYSGGRESTIADILKGALTNIYGCRAEFVRRLRKLAWTSVFEQMEFRKWLDSKQQDRFLRDVQRDSTIPFTADNIKSTLENVWLNRQKLFDESVANVFDELCSHAVENGSGPIAPGTIPDWKIRRGEGWKTNDSYKVNERLIFPHGCHYDHDWGEFRTYYSTDAERIYSDLDRILCVLDGRQFDHCRTVRTALEVRFGSLGKLKGVGSFYNRTESQYFEIKFFKKGTVHLKWKRKDLWEKFNIHAAQGKKWLGENTQQYRKYERRSKYKCTRDGCTYIDGVCSQCGALEKEPFSEVKCELCRTVAEYTGVAECPLHRITPSAMPMPQPEVKQIEAGLE